jgi:phosphate/sulfate permease
VNYNSIVQIGVSWLITIPGGAILSIMFFVALSNMFGI